MTDSAFHCILLWIYSKTDQSIRVVAVQNKILWITRSNALEISIKQAHSFCLPMCKSIRPFMMNLISVVLTYESCFPMHPDSKIHVANMGPTWVLSSPGGPHVGPMNLGIRVVCVRFAMRILRQGVKSTSTSDPYIIEWTAHYWAHSLRTLTLPHLPII